MNVAHHSKLLWKTCLVCLLAGFAVVITSDAQTPLTPAGPELAAILNFEVEQTGTMPRGWSGSPRDTIAIDETIVHSGRRAARLERTDTSAQAFTTITKVIPVDFGGYMIEWRGFLRSEDVRDFTGLWLREDGDAGSIAFNSMQQQQPLKGTHDWSEYSIKLPLRPEAKQIVFGVNIAGPGKAWADDLQLLVDGRPVWEAPKVSRVRNVLDEDHEFDGGSKIDLSSLTPIQTENLALLGKVWGFLKYHHPEVAAGKYHWDYQLFRVMPKVLAANSHDAGTAAVVKWIRSLPEVSECERCTELSKPDLQLGPELKWLNEYATLGPDLPLMLNTIYRNRQPGSKFYISQVTNVGNPVFEHELAYSNIQFPDPGYQLLALFRYWNIIEYWYPNRNILDQNWDDVLREFIPKIALAKNKSAYGLEMIQLIGRITDTHASLNLPPQVLPPAGSCQLPLVTRFIEEQAVVTGYSEPAGGPHTGIKIGDVIESLDGVPIQQLISDLLPYYPASNDVTRLRNISRAMTRGACASVRVGIRREDGASTVSAERVPLEKLNLAAGTTHDRPGETFQLLGDDVAYLKLSSIKAADLPGYINRARNTKGLIIDIRNYPSEFVVFALGSLLVDQPTPFARFTKGDPGNPGAFYWGGSLKLMPEGPHYGSKVVILVDETSVSQAEYTTMAFRSVRGAIVVGSTTAGADGNVSTIPLPGALVTVISGLGVFYPDNRPTQRVGIVPDIQVLPTLAGILAGRDEVLDEAIRQIRIGLN